MSLNSYIDIAKKAGGPAPLQETFKPKDESTQASVGLTICERLKERKAEDGKSVQMTPAWSVPAN